MLTVRADMLTCFRLMTNLEARLEKEDLYRVFRDQEMPLATIIASTHNLARVVPLLRRSGAGER